MKQIVITGAAGGLGGAAALYLAEKGWKVYALDFQKSSFSHPQIVPIFVDISKDESVTAAAEAVRQHTAHLDAIVNFAGIMIIGSAVELPAEEMHRIMNINYLGTYRINRTFFSFLKQGEGRIVNVSSETGVLSPPPFNSFYFVSKHAIEKYSDALRRELCFLGIKVIKIRPGAFETNLQGTAMQKLQQAVTDSTHFGHNIARGNDLAKYGTTGAKNPPLLAQIVHKALTVKRPKRTYEKNINYLLRFMSWLPEGLQDFIYFKVLK